MQKSKKDLKLLFVNVCLRPDGFTKVLPVGLASVMTYFETKGYDFTLLDIDIDTLTPVEALLKLNEIKKEYDL